MTNENRVDIGSIRHRAPKGLAWGTLLVALIGFAVLAWDYVRAASPSQPAVSARSVALPAVTLAQATLTSWPVTVTAMGAITPWQEAVLSAQVAGLPLEEIRAEVGDRVRRGQILARFDHETLANDESRLLAQWRQADANRARALALMEGGGISDQDRLQYLTQAEVAKAQLQSVQLQLRRAVIVAPDDGIVSSRTATLGSVSSSGQELFRLIRQGRLEWRGEIAATQLAQVKPGQRIELSLPDGRQAAATVRQTAPSLNVQSRLGTVFADIQPGSAARAGMYVQGRIDGRSTPAVVIPASCIVIRDGRSYAMALDPQNRARQALVVVGRRQADSVEIVSGLAGGDRVIAQGAGFVQDGDSVRVVPSPSDSTGTKERT